MTSRLRAVDRVWWWTAAATVVALILWVQQLGAPLFLDEGASWFLAYQPTWSGFWDLLRVQEVAPPPFYVGLRFVVHDLGQDGHVAMRLPVVLTTLPVVPLGAVLARQLGATRVGTALAAWLLATSPLMLEYAQQVRAYGPTVTMTMLAVVLVVRAERRGWPTRASWAAGIALGLAPWVHYVALAPVATLLAVVLVRAPAAARVRLVAGAVPLWGLAGWFAHGQYQEVGGGLDPFVGLGWRDLRHVLATGWDGRFDGGGWVLLVGVAALAVAVALVVRTRGAHRAVLLAGLSGPVAIVVLSAVGPDITATRYLVPAAPLVLVGLAAAVRTSRATWVGAAVLLVAGAAGVWRSLDPATGAYPDAEAVVRSTLPEFRGGGVLVTDDQNTSLWLAVYVAERSGVQNFNAARGAQGLVGAMCAKRPVRQLVAPRGALPAQEGWFRAFGYTARSVVNPESGLVLIVADPTPRAACPPASAAPPVV